ncbi:MAG: hypothetical protein VCE91_20575 [Nitrospinota bacterium]|jgi:hypothetical protein
MAQSIGVLIGTIVVYLFSMMAVINIFELLRRKIAGEENATVSGVLKDTSANFRGEST